MLSDSGDACVVVFLIAVDQMLPSLRGLSALLTAEETARAARYLYPEVRNQFVVARGCLRLLLGAHLGRPPRAVPLAEGPYGKLSTPGVCFNVSHAHGLVAIAVSRHIELGVDVEYQDRSVELLEVAKTAFPPEALAELQHLPEGPARRKRFFQMWTEQEARVKCLGLGLAHPEGVRAATDLQVYPLAVPSGYSGMLCLTGEAGRFLPAREQGRIIQQKTLTGDLVQQLLAADNAGEALYRGWPDPLPGDASHVT